MLEARGMGIGWEQDAEDTRPYGQNIQPNCKCRVFKGLYFALFAPFRRESCVQNALLPHWKHSNICYTQKVRSRISEIS
jgi:hypothetical protein